MVQIKFVEYNGSEHTVDVPEGTSLMEAALRNSVPGIDGDCGGAMACATCHVYIPKEWAAVAGSRSAAEQDMLEMAEEVNEESRLGCQVQVTPALEGMSVRLPEGQF